LLLSAAACSGAEPVVPETYASTYLEVRDCRRSADHDLEYIRVLADPAAAGTYEQRDAPFAEGAVVVKEQYRNEDCTDLVRLTAMRKEAAGFDPTTGDWQWQELAPDFTVNEEADPQRCISCHTLCGVAPGGHDFTCAEP
jgi:hypothetical protein